MPPKVIEINDPKFDLDGIYVCSHSWSPYANIVINHLLKNNNIPIFTISLDEKSTEWQLEKLGQVSHGWGEIIRVNNQIKSEMENYYDNIIKSVS